MTLKNTPSHIIYQVVEGKNDKAHWTKIGAAWAHQDAEGFNLVFNAIPLTGNIVIRKKDAQEKGE